MARVVVNVPAEAKRGEVIEIRTLAGHPMETGFRRTQLGELIPRDIIRTLVCTYNGVEVFRAELHPGDRGQSAHHLHHRRHRERHAGIPLDRRQRLLGEPQRYDQGRLRRAFCGAVLRPGGRGRDPARRAPLAATSS